MGLTRRLLLPLARLLARWVQSLLADQEPLHPEARIDAPSAVDPPAHWLSHVRRVRPELVASLGGGAQAQRPSGRRGAAARTAHPAAETAEMTPVAIAPAASPAALASLLPAAGARQQQEGVAFPRRGSERTATANGPQSGSERWHLGQGRAKGARSLSQDPSIEDTDGEPTQAALPASQSSARRVLEALVTPLFGRNLRHRLGDSSFPHHHAGTAAGDALFPTADRRLIVAAAAAAPPALAARPAVGGPGWPARPPLHGVAPEAPTAAARAAGLAGVAGEVAASWSAPPVPPLPPAASPAPLRSTSGPPRLAWPVETNSPWPELPPAFEPEPAALVAALEAVRRGERLAREQRGESWSV